MLVTSQFEAELNSSRFASPAMIKQESDAPISTSKESPKSAQTLTTPSQGISSSQSSAVSVVSQPQCSTSLSPSHSTSSSQVDVLKRAHSFLEEDGNGDQDARELIEHLVKALSKSRAETNQHKIQAQLLSMSAKDADMRYQVENDLVKSEVQKLKTQNDQVEYLMGKVTGQKQLIKKYKNEIINKNKEINRLKTKINDYAHGGKKRRKSSTSPTTENGMLDTLGLLASQVLTEEEQSEPPKASFRR